MLVRGSKGSIKGNRSLTQSPPVYTSLMYSSINSFIFTCTRTTTCRIKYIENINKNEFKKLIDRLSDRPAELRVDHQSVVLLKPYNGGQLFAFCFNLLVETVKDLRSIDGRLTISPALLALIWDFWAPGVVATLVLIIQIVLQFENRQQALFLQC